MLELMLRWSEMSRGDGWGCGGAAGGLVLVVAEGHLLEGWRLPGHMSTAFATTLNYAASRAEADI